MGLETLVNPLEGIQPIVSLTGAQRLAMLKQYQTPVGRIAQSPRNGQQLSHGLAGWYELNPQARQGESYDQERSRLALAHQRQTEREQHQHDLEIATLKNKTLKLQQQNKEAADGLTGLSSKATQNTPASSASPPTTQPVVTGLSEGRVDDKGNPLTTGATNTGGPSDMWTAADLPQAQSRPAVSAPAPSQGLLGTVQTVAKNLTQPAPQPTAQAPVSIPLYENGAFQPYVPFGVDLNQSPVATPPTSRLVALRQSVDGIQTGLQTESAPRIDLNAAPAPMTPRQLSTSSLPLPGVRPPPATGLGLLAQELFGGPVPQVTAPPKTEQTLLADPKLQAVLTSGQSPFQVRRDLKRLGYTTDQANLFMQKYNVEQTYNDRLNQELAATQVRREQELKQIAKNQDPNNPKNQKNPSRRFKTPAGFENTGLNWLVDTLNFGR